ncbi:UNVERIFIED_CONTAM: hypothetical protein GTU68_020697 [Idotea baltica]|nr:hypothetical protein [Idotea baltica]
MLGYMNEEAYKITLDKKLVTFYSRSRKKLWTKGETSNNFLDLVDLKLDCDCDTFLISANPRGPVCHTGEQTCFKEENKTGFLKELEAIILDRKNNPQEKSYTNKLFTEGRAKITQKVGEEAIELVIEAMKDDKDLFKEEVSDFMYHLLVLFADMGISLTEIEEVLRKRNS